MRNDYYESNGCIHIIVKRRKGTHEAIIDASDLPKMDKVRRVMFKDGRSNKPYAYCAMYDGSPMLLQRYILDTPKDHVVVFGSPNGFDCRRSNICNSRYRNLRINAGKPNVHKGIYKRHRLKHTSYVLRVTVNGVYSYIGSYPTAEAAIAKREEIQ